MKRAMKFLVLGLILAQGLYIVFKQVRDGDHRHFEWVSLAETSYREVSFQNPKEGLSLSGLLFVPHGAGPFPGAVIIHGSGASRRDSGWYLTLAKYLQENGIVVLLPDKRGSEKSDGDWRTAGFESPASDTVAAVVFLRGQDEVAVTGIGVIGLSQGGHIAPLAAGLSADIAYVVNVVGAAVPMHELLIYEETHNIMEFGLFPGLAHALAYPAAWSIIEFRQKAFWDAIGNFDPRPYWRRLDVPALVLYGENDTNVPSAKSAEILRGLDKPNIEVKIYEGSGHALESPRGEGNRIFRRDALRDIRDFIHSTVPAPQ